MIVNFRAREISRGAHNIFFLLFFLAIRKLENPYDENNLKQKKYRIHQ
jgi:hypothetical protein